MGINSSLLTSDLSVQRFKERRRVMKKIKLGNDVHCEYVQRAQRGPPSGYNMYVQGLTTICFKGLFILLKEKDKGLKVSGGRKLSYRLDV